MSLLDGWKRLFGKTAGPRQSGSNERIIEGSPAGKERRDKPRLNARNGTRVLLIDDSTTILTLLGRMLKQNDYQVYEAKDGETGLDIARKEHPELIFLDIVLPGINGFETLRRLRRDPALQQVPVIMISGNEQATEQFYAQRIGADDFMKKPFSRSEVFAKIERLLDAHLVPKRMPAQTRSGVPANEEEPG